MKQISIILLILSFIGLSFAADADLYNQGTVIDLRTKLLSNYANACAVYETADQVTYVYKATWADSSDQYHSKPFYIGDLNAADAYVRAVGSAAMDCNTIYHFSYDDCNTWVAVTPADLDALSNTAVGDTLGIEAGANDIQGFHASVWLVVELDAGGTTLNDDEYVIWVASFQKDGTYIQGYPTPTVLRVRNTSVTNP